MNDLYIEDYITIVISLLLKKKSLYNHFYIAKV